MVKVRNSKNRSIVLDTIKNEASPISADKIYESMNKIQKINLSTIYRILNTLTNQKLITKQIGQDGIFYYEINDNTHKHNIICDKCNNVTKINYCPIKEIESTIKKETNFDITNHIIEFHGICEKCRKN